MEQYFNFLTTNEELIDRFITKMKKDGQDIFGNLAISNARFTVSDNQARAFVNENGAYTTAWKELVNLFSRAPNKVTAKWRIHRAKIVEYMNITSAPSLQTFFNQVRDFLKKFKASNGEWNVVYYGFYKEFLSGV